VSEADFGESLSGSGLTSRLIRQHAYSTSIRKLDQVPVYPPIPQPEASLAMALWAVLLSLVLSWLRQPQSPYNWGVVSE
jgi:hypothetical protein